MMIMMMMIRKLPSGDEREEEKDRLAINWEITDN